MSKTRTGFYRKIYLAFLIDSEQHNVPSLMKVTGMARRTIQDTLKTLAEIDIRCSFVQQPGALHNSGYYQIEDWGPIQPDWVNAQLDTIRNVLDCQ